MNGLAYGTSVADAPDGTAVGGDLTGTVGGTGTMDLDFARAKVSVDSHDYIIQNNNWGNPTGTDLVLSYKNNSFKITSGSGTGGDAPASFPSIYIGANGNTSNGMSTSTNDNLPLQISTHRQHQQHPPLQRQHERVQRGLRHLVRQCQTNRAVQRRHRRLRDDLAARIPRANSQSAHAWRQASRSPARRGMSGRARAAPARWARRATHRWYRS